MTWKHNQPSDRFPVSTLVLSVLCAKITQQTMMMMKDKGCAAHTRRCIQPRTLSIHTPYVNFSIHSNLRTLAIHQGKPLTLAINKFGCVILSSELEARLSVAGLTNRSFEEFYVSAPNSGTKNTEVGRPRRCLLSVYSCSAQGAIKEGLLMSDLQYLLFMSKFRGKMILRSFFSVPQSPTREQCPLAA